MTEWRSVPSFPDYEASDEGDIRRVRFTNARCYKRFVPLCQVPDTRYGYLSVHLWDSVGRKKRLVNRLVCEAFHGRQPPGKYEAAHWDGNKTNNTPSNLRWATPLENSKDKRRHGVLPIGERNAMARLTLAQVSKIREIWPTLPRSSGGAKLADHAADSLAIEMGVHRKTLYGIAVGLSWTSA